MEVLPLSPSLSLSFPLCLSLSLPSFPLSPLTLSLCSLPPSPLPLSLCV